MAPSDMFLSRMMHERAGTEHATLEAAIQATGEVVTWRDASAACAVDVDYDDPPQGLDARVARIRPSPAFRWRTRSNGVRLIYLGPHANEWAGLAALAYSIMDPMARVELKTDTRHPPGSWDKLAQNNDPAPILSWLGRTVDDDAVTAYREANGLDTGMRFDHDRCPVDPGPGTDCVVVNDAGIYCHKCAGTGRRFGSRKPGWFPWNSLVPGGSPTILGTMLKARTHWEHARLVLESVTGLRGSVAESCWRAALRLVHGDVHEAVFVAGRDMVRRKGLWSTADGRVSYRGRIAPLLAALPAAKYLDATGEWKTDAVKVALYEQPVDPPEYPPVGMVRGIAVSGPPDRGFVQVTCDATRPPRYVPRSERVDWASTFATVLPGLNVPYAKLLVHAKGISEKQIGLPPLIGVDGVSRSGKSNTVSLVAAMLGDRNTEVLRGQDITRFRQSIIEGAVQGTFVTANELFKGIRNPHDAVDVFLTLTPESVSHVMYVGPVALGCSPVLVGTDISFPETVRNDVQFGRRFVHVNLAEPVDWERTLVDAGVFRPSMWRDHEVLAKAADAFLSECMDAFNPSLPLSDVAKGLGFNTFQAEATEARETLAEFRAAWEQAPEGRERGFRGAGWRIVRQSDTSELARIYLYLADKNDWTMSRAIMEFGWKGEVARIQSRGDAVGIKFEARK